MTTAEDTYLAQTPVWCDNGCSHGGTSRRLPSYPPDVTIVPPAVVTGGLDRAASQRAAPIVAAAFAQERDVPYAVRLLSVAVDTKIDFTMRCVRGEDASMQLCILVASFADPAVASRIETAMEGAHGMVVPIDSLDAAKTA